MSEHRCHHPHCVVLTNPEVLACRRHWFQLPKRLRDAVWATYRKGQEIDKNPSEEYMVAATACRDYWLTR